MTAVNWVAGICWALIPLTIVVNLWLRVRETRKREAWENGLIADYGWAHDAPEDVDAMMHSMIGWRYTGETSGYSIHRVNEQYFVNAWQRWPVDEWLPMDYHMGPMKLPALLALMELRNDT